MAARRLPAKTINFCYNKFHFKSTKFFIPSFWQMWRMPERPSGSGACSLCYAMDFAPIGSKSCGGHGCPELPCYKYLVEMILSNCSCLLLISFFNSFIIVSSFFKNFNKSDFISSSKTF